EAGGDEPGQDSRFGAGGLRKAQAVQARTAPAPAAALPPGGPLVPEARALPCAVRSARGAERRLPGERRVRRCAEARAAAAPHHADGRVVRRGPLACSARSPPGGVRADEDSVAVMVQL